MKKNNGFTLVELLAVIVILAVIALIATPIVLNMIESSRKGAAESSALSYIDATEKSIMTGLMNSTSSTDYDKTYIVEGLMLTEASSNVIPEGGKLTPKSENPVPLKLEIKGDQPTVPGTDDPSNYVVVTNNAVTTAKLRFGKYYVAYFYENGKAVYCAKTSAFADSAASCNS